MANYNPEREQKLLKIVKLMIQEVPTDRIARQTGYSIHYIRDIYNELREKYGANTKAGIATAFLMEKIRKTRDELSALIDIVENHQK